MALASGSIAEMREICISYLINKKNKIIIEQNKEILNNDSIQSNIQIMNNIYQNNNISTSNSLLNIII